ncbi:hypothetical protein Tco_0919764 [Tanacetum coccineum]
MSTRSNSSNLFSSLRDPESLIRRKNLGEPSSLFDFKEVLSIPHNNMGPPPAGPPPPNNNGPPPVVRPNGQAPRSMEELCQPFIDGRGGPIAPIPIQATDFGLPHHMIQQSPEVVRQLEMMNKNFLDMMRQIQSVKSVDTKCETCGGPHSFTECPAVGGYTQVAAYATTDKTSRNISSTTSTESPEVVRQLELKNKNFVEMMRQIQSVKSVNPKCENYGGPHSFTKCPAADGYTQADAYATTGDVKAITTRSGVAYDGPMIPPILSPVPNEVERETEATKDKVQNTSLGSTAHVQPSVVQDLILEPEVASKPKPKPSIPYPSRLNDQKLCEKANNQMLKFFQIYQKLHFDISFTDALLHMPKFASTFKSLLSNKEKLFELANTLLNENCSAVLLKKLPEKLGDPGKLFIPCDFLEPDECLALADLGASINLMPFSVWKQLSLSELTSTRIVGNYI